MFEAKKILGIKFKFNEISLILRVLNEFISRSVDEKIDYSKEINKLLKLYPDLKYKYEYKKKFFN